MAELTAKIGIDTTEFVKGTNDCREAIEKYKKSTENAREESKEFAKTQDKQINAFKKTVNAMETAIETNLEAKQSYTSLQRGLTELKNQYDALADDVKGGAFGSALKSQMDTVRKSMTKLKSDMQSVSKAVPTGSSKSGGTYGLGGLKSFVGDKLLGMAPSQLSGMLGTLSKFGSYAAAACTAIAAIGVAWDVAMTDPKRKQAVQSLCDGFKSAIGELKKQLSSGDFDLIVAVSTGIAAVEVSNAQQEKDTNEKLNKLIDSSIQRDVAKYESNLAESKSDKTVPIPDTSRLDDILSRNNRLLDDAIKDIEVLANAKKKEILESTKQTVAGSGYSFTPSATFSSSKIVNGIIVDVKNGVYLPSEIKKNLNSRIKDLDEVLIPNATNEYKKFEFQYLRAKQNSFTTENQIQLESELSSAFKEYQKLWGEKLILNKLLTREDDLVNLGEKYSEIAEKEAAKDQFKTKVKNLKTDANSTQKSRDDEAERIKREAAENAKKLAEAQRKAFIKAIEDFDLKDDLEDTEKAVITSMKLLWDNFVTQVDYEIADLLESNINPITGKRRFKIDLSNVEEADPNTDAEGNRIMTKKSIRTALDNRLSKINEESLDMLQVGKFGEANAGIKSLNGSFSTLHDTIESFGDIDNPFAFFDSLTTIVGEVVSIIQTMDSLGKAIQSMAAISTAAAAEEAAANATTTVSETTAATAKTFNAHAEIPFVGIAIAAGLIGLMIGSMLATKSKAQLASRFANGGIVEGNSYTGDRVHAMVNSGEMVLNKRQQANLFNMANGIDTIGRRSSKVEIVGETRISNKDILISYKNAERSSSRH